MSNFSASPFQAAIFDFITHGSGSAIVEAVAGSGKTTLMTHAVKLIPANQTVLMLAFNKVIADELSTRVGSRQNTDVKTFHSLGFSGYRATHGSKVKVDNNKMYRLIDDLVNNSDLTPGEKAGISYVSKIVNLGKSAGIGTHLIQNTAENWWNLIEHHDVGGRDEGVNFEEIIPICQEILSRSNNMKFIINFDDMIYLPVQQGINFKKYDWVFVDEAQDTSQTQREILKSVMKSSSRLIAVGDRNQSLYGFRGADSLSIDGIQKDFSCATFPLSISYRCSKSVVMEAKAFVPQIESSETAKDGSVISLDKYSTDDFLPTDGIICRNSAPIVKMAYGLISRGVPVNVRGREIGKGLTSLIKTMKAKDIKNLDEKLSEWSDNQVIILSGKGGREAQIEGVLDKVDCIKIFISQAEPKWTILDLIQRIENFFSDNPNGNITLSTVHGAKGLEFKRTYILDRDRFNPKWVRLDWQKEQERNVIYVAITRAIESLIYISSGSWKD